MGTLDDLPVDRRQFIAGAGAAMIGGCVSCPDELAAPWATGMNALGDVHAHFFNMSDLPIRGFIEHVLVPNRAPDYVAAAKAAGDLFHALKKWAPTIEGERRGLYLPIGSIPARHVDERRYAEGVAGRINDQSGGAGSEALVPERIDFSRPAATLSQSYVALAAIVNDAALAATVNDAEGSPPFRRQLRVTPERIQHILSEAGRAERSLVQTPEDPCAVEPAPCAEETCQEPKSSLSMQLDQILTLFRWVWDMMEGRCRHVRQYLDQTKGGTWRPRLIVNLLVDYDAWLADGPAAGSSHEAQIEFWADLGARVRKNVGVEIVTFAGFDPLKDAEQRLMDVPSSFKRAQAFHRQGKIGGFKLYPPMGFKPSGNRKGDYEGTDRARGIVGGRWRDDPVLSRADIGDEIDTSLRGFYDFCIAGDVPVLSHAIPGNQSACCFGQRANPMHWADLFEREPQYGRLRLCLGHIVSDAQCFVKAMKGGEAPPHLWALHGTARLLRMSAEGRANVYADIGYLSEILRRDDQDSERFAVEFFAALKTYCLKYDPCCQRVLFGSDWIVIGWELGYHRYVDLILHGMHKSGWSAEWQDNLLRRNLLRFLGREAVELCPLP